MNEMAAKRYGERWEIIEEAGKGGQGHAFIVQDAKGIEKERCVLKRLQNPNRIGRFGQEVTALQKIKSPYVIRMIDFDTNATPAYIVTEYCGGKDLASADPKFWIDDPVAALKLFLEICEGVKAAHSCNPGIVHRDIKPENIFLRTPIGPAVLGDFGICYYDTDDGRFTAFDEAVGARYFIAPELENGRTEKVTTKSDIYSLGKLLYWLVSGGKKFAREEHRSHEFDIRMVKPSLPRRGLSASPTIEYVKPILEHINMILDHMIVHTPERRWDLNRVIEETQLAMTLLQDNFNVIAPDTPQKCIYCGRGNYEEMIDQNGNPLSPDNFGFNRMVSAVHRRIIACNFCGNIQMFQLDDEELANRWGLKPRGGLRRPF